MAAQFTQYGGQRARIIPAPHRKPPMKIATRLLGSVAVSLAFACSSMAMAQKPPVTMRLKAT
jgi:hypothetical protein